MNTAKFGHREASLDKPRKLLQRSTPIGGAISIRGSVQSLACPMSGKRRHDNLLDLDDIDLAFINSPNSI